MIDEVKKIDEVRRTIDEVKKIDEVRRTIHGLTFFANRTS